MVRQWQDQDDEERDPEEPEDFDRDDDPDGTDTEPCPLCGEEVHYRTDICPHCGNFILRNEPARLGTVWVVAAVVLVIVLLGGILVYGRL